MRFLPYILLSYLAVGVQAGLSGFVHLGGAAPNLVLVVAAFFALFAPREPALLACVLLGFMHDLLTRQTLGLYALSYGAIGLMLVSTATMMYREHPLTHAALALGGSMLTWILLIVHGWIYGPSAGFATPFLSTILTALISPAVFWGLMKLRPLLGIRVSRRW